MPAFFGRRKISVSKSPPKDGAFKRLFVHKDLFIKKQEQMTFVALTTARQSVLFSAVLLLCLWGIFTSFYFFYHNRFVSSTNKELKQTKTAYAYLEKEIRAFEDYVSQIVVKLDENESNLFALKEETQQQEEKIQKQEAFEFLKKTVFEEKKEALKNVNEDLQEKTFFIKNRLLDLKEYSSLVRVKEKKQTLNQIVLQRDIAVTQAISLQKKVEELETLIENMQETQILVFRKMAGLADKNALLIEEDMAEVKTALLKTGLSMETLLKRLRRSKEEIGLGGPYIPVPMPKPQHRLNISLVSLNDRLNRWYDLTALQKSLPLGKPIERIRVTSSFGSRGDPFQGAPAQHEGVDLAGMIGEPIHTKADGKVVRAGPWGWYGNIVEIDHGLGFRTRYAHMDRIFVSKDDTVRAGDRIGTLGNTGRSTGPHLHYEVRINGHAVNPMNFIKAGNNVFKN